MSESNRPYPVRVDVRLTEAEREYLTQEAIKRDMSRQDMMRKLLLSDIDAVAPVKDYKPVAVSNGRDAIDRAILRAQAFAEAACNAIAPFTSNPQTGDLASALADAARFAALRTS